MTPGLARQKIQAWCAYQERSQHETRQKLFGFGLDAEITESLIAELISENFINEERFSLAFAGGKFRIKHWGKNKIRTELRFHKVSEYCIRKALEAIDPEQYERTLQKELIKKLKTVKNKNSAQQFHSVLKCMISRGFESELVKDHLNNIIKGVTDESGFEE